MKDITAEWERVGQTAVKLQPFFDENEVPERDHVPFAYYYSQAPTNATPEWTLDQFDRGIMARGSYEGYDLDKVDWYGRLLVPNYSEKSGGLSPVLDAAKPLANSMIEALETGSILASSNHPTIPSPIVTTRSVIEALKPSIPDIQDRIYITYGFLPVTFKYKFGPLEISPVGFATGMANLAITAAISDSNLHPELQEWQSRYRGLYKANVASKLAERGNIVITALNGQRDVAFGGKFSPKARRINQPEGDLSVFAQRGAKFLNFAIFDHLLEDAGNPGSPVELYANPRLVPVTVDELERSNAWQAVTLDPTYDGSPYYHEGVSEMRRRVADRARVLGGIVSRKMHHPRP
ncbi:hypothetical protein BH10PAT3_BH10PAT3_6500 [soil metagenome]